MFIGNRVRPETMCILRKVMEQDYLDQWGKEVTDQVVWPEAKMLIAKYTPFIMVRDFTPFKEIFSTTCSEQF
jgi:hypothetical protein